MNILKTYFTKGLFVVVIQMSTKFGFAQTWEGHFSYLNISDIVNVNDKIYAAADNSIFSYDTASHNFDTVSTINGLSGETITTFHYSYEYELIVIGYDNGLIEIYNEATKEIFRILDIVNKATIPPENKKINHFNEYNSTLYIATNYGISVYNLEYLEFGDTYYIGNNGQQISIRQTVILGDKIYANCENSQGVKTATINNSNLIDFQQWTTTITGDFLFLATNENHMIVTSTNGVTSKVNTNNSLTPLFVNTTPPKDLYFSNELLAVTLENSVHIYDDNFNLTNTINLPSEYQNMTSCSIVFENNVFIGTKSNTNLGKSSYGVLKTSLSESSAFEEIYPNGPLLNKIFEIHNFNQDLWVLFGGYSSYYNISGGIKRTGISHYKNNEWQNITYDSINAQVDEPYFLSNVAVDPFEPTNVYVSSYFSGLFKINQGSFGPLFNSTNSSLEQFVNTYNLTLESTFDDSGNLWVLNGRVDRPLNKFTNGQWTSYDFTSLIPTPSDNLGFSDIIVNDNKIFIGSYSFGLIGLDLGQGISSLKGVYGEDPANLPSNYIRALALDKNNVLWIGTFKGLRILYNMSNFFTEETIQTEPIVILEDGLPKELLELQFITDIIVDGSNNKWISTADAGVFYLSSDGKKTIYHFTKDNSPLPSNNVNTMAQNKDNGTIYFGTTRGLVSFKAGGSSPSNSLEDTFVYPNPIRPGFNLELDKVKIQNLSENVNIKITDVEGNLVAEAESNTNLRFNGNNLEIDGGTAYWNGKNLANKTVASGVYVVMISDLDNLETKVLKIMLIRQ